MSDATTQGAADGTAQAPAAGVLDAAAMARLRLAVARLNRQMVQASSGQDLTFAQISALARIAEHGPLRLGELAARERVAAPTMTRTIAPLAAAGLVGKEPDPQDGRSHLIALTAVGKEMIERMRRQRLELLVRRIGRLSAGQSETLLAAIPVLELLAEEADAEGPGAGGPGPAGA
jgi:DNA-binding MarR family transcriptional regulator